MPLPDSFITHLRQVGYHPRSNKHSNALAEAIVRDLLEACQPLATDARAGKVVYDLNMDLRVGTATWNVDLVLGTPPSPVDTGGAFIVRATPATVKMAIEINSVMTEHRKAVKNRKRDFEAHHDYVHKYGSHTIAGGVIVVNAATEFSSPLRTTRTLHGDRTAVDKLVQHCLNEMRNVSQSGSRDPHGMDARAALVIDFSDMALQHTRYVSRQPAPQLGDPLHYDSFIQRLCAEYTARFAAPQA